MTDTFQPLWLKSLFLLGVSLLFTHELDAMTHSEWRVLPLTSWMAPGLGRVVFVALHVPIFALVLGWLTSRLPERACRGSSGSQCFWWFMPVCMWSLVGCRTIPLRAFSPIH